jgi:hypothetical protein
MPLHADGEAPRRRRARQGGELDRLHRPVGRPRRAGQPVAQPVDRLMVVRGHLDPVPVRGGPVECGPRPARLVPVAGGRARTRPNGPARGENAADRAGGADADRVPAEVVGDPGVLLVPDHVREVLVQRAAADDVEQLHAAADGQQRQPGRQRAVDHGQFPGVPLGVGRAGRRVHGRAVPGRVHVTAAGHHQAVEVGHGQRGLRGGAAGRQQDRPAAAAAYRVHVGTRQHRGRYRPVTPLGDVVVGGNADQRSHGNRSYLGRSGRAGSGGAASGSPG